MTPSITEFRRLHDDEAEASYRILVDSVDWLLARGIRQWTVPYPRRLYDRDQAQGRNFGLFQAARLVAVVMISQEPMRDWHDEVGAETVWQLARLAVARDYHGCGLGGVTLNAAIRHAWAEGAGDLWLDCVTGNGFLPGFYRKHGFETVTAKTITYSTGPFDMMLMRRHTPPLD